MKFLGQPHFIIKDQEGHTYRLKSHEKWNNLRILQEPSGYWAVASSEGNSIGFEYMRLEPINNYLVAYAMDEKGRYFHVYDKNGNALKDENEQKIKGKSYEETGKRLLISARDESFFYIKKDKIEHLKKATFITVKYDYIKFVAIIKLTFDGEVRIEGANPQRDRLERASKYLFPLSIETPLNEEYVEDYTANVMRFNKGLSVVIKIIVTINSKNKYITYFEVTKNDLYEENQVSLAKAWFRELRHEICCSWYEQKPEYVLCNAEDGKKILYDLKQDMILCETKVAVDDMEIGKWPFLVYFYSMQENEKIYKAVFNTRVYKFVLDIPVKNLTCMISDQTQMLAWQAETLNGKKCILTTNDIQYLSKDVYNIKRYNNSIVVKEFKKKMHYISIYSASDTIEKIAEYTQKVDMSIDNVSSITQDIVIVATLTYKYCFSCTYYVICYKGICIKKMYNFKGLNYKECGEKWVRIKENNGFIKLPKVGRYFIDHRNKKAYSVFSVRYWFEKIKRLVY